jgi:ketosteroid isomerase-like protein
MEPAFGWRELDRKVGTPPRDKSTCKIGQITIGYAARVGRFSLKVWFPRSEEIVHRAPVDNANSYRAGGWRWLIYLAVALAGALLTFVGARAQQKATDDATFRKLVDAYCAAWSTGNAEAPAKFYAKDNGLVFYDVAPFAYHSWKEYQVGVQKEFLDTAESIKLTAGKDLKVTRRGMIAWTTVPMHLTEKTKAGKTDELDLRYTGIWEKRGASWVLVHEHLSTPLAGS